MTASRQAGTPWGVVLGVLRRQRRDVAWLAAWSAVEALPALVLGRTVAGAIDSFGSGDRAAGLAWLGVLLAAAAVSAAGARLSFGRLAAVVEPLRDRLVAGVVAAAIHGTAAGPRTADTSAVARITHQAEIVRDSFAGLVTTVRTAAFTAGAALLGLATLALPVAAIAIVPVLASLALFAGLMPALAARQRRYVISEEEVTTAAGTVASGLRDIVACGAEDRAAAETGSRVAAQARAGRALAGLTAVRTLVLAVGCWLPVLLVIGTSPWLLGHGVTVGGVIGALAYLTGGLQLALNTLVQGTGSSAVRMTVTLERILAGTRGAITSPAGAASPGLPRQERRAASPAVPAGSTVRLHGVGFGYGPHTEPVIRDLWLDIPEGDHLAVVGPSGIGKSTLAALIAGLLRPTAGQVLLGGVPACAVGFPALAGLRVLIPQQSYAFTGTVRENLAYLRPDATTGELDAAVDAVGAGWLVRRAGGYSGSLDPASLSDGERQLISLARAYLSPAPVIILDEATCHLDPAAEARAEEAFARRPGTLIVIAHRATSALRARRILVLDGARAQAGDHEALLAGSALYADLMGHWHSLPGQRLAAPAAPGVRTGPGAG